MHRGDRCYGCLPLLYLCVRMQCVFAKSEQINEGMHGWGGAGRGQTGRMLFLERKDSCRGLAGGCKYLIIITIYYKVRSTITNDIVVLLSYVHFHRFIFIFMHAARRDVFVTNQVVGQSTVLFYPPQPSFPTPPQKGCI